MRAYALARERRRPLVHAVVLALILTGAFVSLFLSKTFAFESHNTAPITGLSLPSIGAVPAADPVLVASALPNTVRHEEVASALQVMANGGEGAAASSTEAAAGGGEAAGAEAAGAAVSEPFALYAVQEGDSASTIAAAHGIDLQYLLWANSDLRDGELLRVGQLLVVPAGNGILHPVRLGDTLSGIAARYDVSVSAIIGWAGNGLASADQVIENALLFIPNGMQPPSILPAEQPQPAPAPAPTAQPPVAVSAPPPPPPPPPPPASANPGPMSGAGLVWPITGPISSYMDYSHPLGIDIDLFNRVGAPIGAATNGTVTFAGGNPCCSYGLYVVVMSPTGIETLYAHFSSIAVSVGQTVTAGQTIGYAGCTGLCTGTHLHFEVIDNGVRVNPLNYLP